MILTILWNIINIMWLGKNRRPLPSKPNAYVHAVLALAFLVLGIVCTFLVARARGKLFNDLYDLQTDGSHDLVAANNATIRVSSQNVQSCPAFSDCTAQQHWLNKAYIRSGIAVGGCVLVVVALYVDLICLALSMILTVLIFLSLLHTLFSIWFTLNTIHGVNPRPAIPRKDEEKHEEEKSSWVQDDKAVEPFGPSLGNDSWNHSDAALLSATASFGVHDAVSRPQTSASVMSAQSSPQFLEAPPPALPNSSHFVSSKGDPRRNFLFSPSVSQLQSMDFPDPVKIDSRMRVGEDENTISPFTFPQPPSPGKNTPNFSRPSSRVGAPSNPMPIHHLYPKVARSSSQRALALSPGLPHHWERRPRTAESSRTESCLSPFPPIPPPKDLRRNQSEWI